MRPYLRKIVKKNFRKCRVVPRATQWQKSGHSSLHSSRALSSAAKPKSSDPHIVPTNLNSSGLTPSFTCANKSRQLSMDWKNLQRHRTHDSRGDDPRHSGQYPQKMQRPETSWRWPFWVFFVIPTKTVLNSLSGASFIFFLWIILFELCPHIRCQSRKIIL